MLQRGSRVVVDGAAICSECGRAIEPTGPDRWRHAPPGRPPARRSRWLFPTLTDLRRCGTHSGLVARYPWAAGSTEGQWHEAVARLERYHARLAAARRARRLESGQNPYADLVELLAAPAPPAAEAPEQLRYWGLPHGLAQLLDLSRRRQELVEAFAWSIPSEDALATLTRFAPLVECGAGTGYWLALLRARGVDAVGYDLHEPGPANAYHRRGGRWTEVAQASAVASARRHSDRALFLCWPPYDDDAASYAPLRAYRGEVVVHVGDPGGASGSVRFHRELALNWTPVEQVALPHWPRVDDRLVVYRRNRVRLPHRQRDRCTECGRFVAAGWIGRCDECFAARPPALALRVGRHRVEYAREALEAMPPALVAAFERSPARLV